MLCPDSTCCLAVVFFVEATSRSRRRPKSNGACLSRSLSSAQFLTNPRKHALLNARSVHDPARSAPPPPPPLDCSPRTAALAPCPAALFVPSNVGRRRGAARGQEAKDGLRRAHARGETVWIGSVCQHWRRVDQMRAARQNKTEELFLHPPPLSKRDNHSPSSRCTSGCAMRSSPTPSWRASQRPPSSG